MYAHFNFPKLTTTNKVLIFSVLGISVLFLIAKSFGINILTAVLAYLIVIPKKIMPWQPFTYFLLNPSIWSLLFNLLALWMFGSVVEKRMGTKKYIYTFSIATIVSGLSYILYAMLFNLSSPFFGMLAGVLALLVSFAYFWPNSKIYIFGVFPVKSKWLVLGYGIIMLLSVSGGLSGRSSRGAGALYMAVITGVFASTIYVHFVFLEYNFLRSFIGKFKNSINSGNNFKTSSDRSSYRHKHPDNGEKNKVIEIREWERKQVDKLLEKVSKYGIKSLNKKEKEFLDRVSSSYSSTEDER